MSKITSKGQVTIPKYVRETLGVHPGDRLAFRIGDDGTVTVEAETLDVRSLRGAIKPKVRGVSVDAMKETIRRTAGRR
ncbi:MAG: AbrB/MazE/SpoVT family DNA-binding domain-containing protein [Gemmatimonadaceae bacterium]